jgi:hypothetical protein
MNNRILGLRNVLTLTFAVTALLCLSTAARAQNTQDNKSAQDPDATRKELAQFDQFLNSHPEIAEQVRKNPSLLDNHEFVENHPALKTFLQDNPGILDAIRQNPTAFMQAAERFDRDAGGRDRSNTREGLAQFRQFLDSHREIAEQLHKDPSLIDDHGFVEDHPALKTFLQDHPEIRDELRQDRYAFLRQDDHSEGADNDHGADDRHDGDSNHDHLASFGEFLGGHSDIAREVSENPAVLKDHEYLESHPELKAYLDANPGVRADLMENPQDFIKEAQHLNYGNGNGTSNSDSTKTPGTAPTDPKSKQ